MKKREVLTTIVGILFTVIAGTLLHFTYEWSGRNRLVGLVSPVNESTWEHMKLLFFPMLAFILVQSALSNKSFPVLNAADSAGLLIGTLLIPVIFYTYTGVIGTHYLSLDILTFIISVIAAFVIRCRLASDSRLERLAVPLAAAVFLMLLLFLIFTVYPPSIGLFRDPESTDK